MSEKTLSKNRVNQFILKIDLTPNYSVNILRQLAETLKDSYKGYKTELGVNFNVNVQTAEVKREDYVTYRLGTPSDVELRIVTFEKSIILQSSHYTDNTLYKKRLEDIIQVLRDLQADTHSIRIGLRYINVFACNKLSDINKVLNPRDAKAIKESVTKRNIARTMIVHEYQEASCMKRVQCGIPNKFYPSIITNFDTVLDIDVYARGNISITEWDSFIAESNHLAYDTFVEYIKESFIKELR